MSLFNDTPDAVREEIKADIILAVGASPAGAFVPLLDMGAIIAIWSKMLYRIGKIHGITLSDSECVKILLACGSSITAYLGGSKLLNWLLNLIPGVGTLGAMAGNVVFNGYYTYAVGMAYHQMLRTEGINGRTIAEIAKLLLKYFVPIPSLDTLKNIYHLVKGDLDEV